MGEGGLEADPPAVGANWDLEAESPGLAIFTNFFQKIRKFKHILIHIFA